MLNPLPQEPVVYDRHLNGVRKRAFSWDTRIALHIRALCRYTVATAFSHHCGKGFSALRKRLSGNAKHAFRTHETHRPERRKSLSGTSGTSGRDRSWHETHVQNAKRRTAEAGMGNAGA